MVRRLPVAGGGNLHLCRACFDHEMAFRRWRNQDLAESEHYPLPAWETLCPMWPDEYREARRILAYCWAEGTSLTQSDYEYLDRRRVSDQENMIDIALRLAGIDWAYSEIENWGGRSQALGRLLREAEAAT